MTSDAAPTSHRPSAAGSRAVRILFAVAAARGLLGIASVPGEVDLEEGSLVLWGVVWVALGMALPWRALAGSRLMPAAVRDCAAGLVAPAPNLAFLSKLVGWTGPVLLLAPFFGASGWVGAAGLASSVLAVALWTGASWARVAWALVGLALAGLTIWAWWPWLVHPASSLEAARPLEHGLAPVLVLLSNVGVPLLLVAVGLLVAFEARRGPHAQSR